MQQISIDRLLSIGINLGSKDKECLLFITDPNLGRTSTETWASLVAQMIKNLPVMQETWDWSLGQEVPLEKEMVTHSSILAWRIPWTEEPGELQSMGLQRVKHDWATNTLWLTLIFLSTFCIRGYIILYNICIIQYNIHSSLHYVLLKKRKCALFNKHCRGT